MNLTNFSYTDLVNEYLRLNELYRDEIRRDVKYWNRQRCEEISSLSEAVMRELDNRRRYLFSPATAQVKPKENPLRVAHLKTA